MPSSVAVAHQVFIVNMVREGMRTGRADVRVFLPLASPSTLYLYRASSAAVTTAREV